MLQNGKMLDIYLARPKGSTKILIAFHIMIVLVFENFNGISLIIFQKTIIIYYLKNYEPLFIYLSSK